MAYPQTSYEHTSFISPSFISKRRDVVYSKTLIYQLDVLKSTGRYDAFKLKWKPIYAEPPDVWPVPKHLFWDSDIAKWLEGACYFLKSNENATVDAAVKELTDMIRSAQQPDGYLNVHYIVVEPGKRFTNLRDMHELYNAGHLIEAALAHNQVYGNYLLLEPIIRYVDLLCDIFGPGIHQRHGYPGHPEIELALLRLYERTQKPSHLALAEYFLEERGNPTGQDGRHYYDVEAEERGERKYEKPAHYENTGNYQYQQAHQLIVDQPTIEGHSVRAMYLLTALADLLRIKDPRDSEAQKAALTRLWDNMLYQKMYLTGGIGAMARWEGFGINYFLPQGTDDGGCYNETCAAIGVMMLAQRLLQIDLDGKFSDIMELCFYNAVATGMSSCGTRFTYINQLASSNSDLSKREKWFTCACCPPNVTRLLGYIGGYLWSFEADERDNTVQVNVHMYSSAMLKVPIGNKLVEITQRSNWPWGGDVDFSVRDVPEVEVSMRLRIPKWASNYEVTPALPPAKVEKGYLTIPASWLKANPKFRLRIPMEKRLLAPHPRTNQNIVALARGPIVYCVEDADNQWVEDHFQSLVFDPTAKIVETAVRESGEIAEPYVSLTAIDAASFLTMKGTAEPGLPIDDIGTVSGGAPKELHFIPYALRDNRGGKGHMRVGLRRK